MNRGDIVARQPSPARLDTVLDVWAHPDDEAYLSAGLIAAAPTPEHATIVQLPVVTRPPRRRRP